MTFARYERTESIAPDELFAGFDELRAVTFSAGVRQIEHVMKNFRRGEVIIGSHEQISVDLAEVLALQKFAVEFVSKNSYLQRRIAAREFKLYVTDRVHAKIYLMCADDGRCRVILTSANFSANAWQSRQRETFVVMDEPAAYEHYLNVFEELKNFSAKEIDVTARPLKDDGSNLEQLPEIKNAAQKFRTLFKEVDVHSDTHGKTLLVAEKIIRMKKIMRRTHEGDVARRKNNSVAPELLWDCDNLRVTFNDEPWDLNPSAAEVRADLQSLIEYVDGAEKFTGDVANLKTLYWKIVLYMFVSPFFARLRYFYSQLVPANSTGKTFPMYMILRGPKNGGKSSIVATGQKLMFDRILPTISAKDTAPSKIESFKLTVKGCPILIDDVTNRNLQYLKDIVKDDSSLISGKILDHGTFIFTSNDVEQIRQEISKRVVVFTVPNQLNEDVAARHDAALKKLQHKMHNALYRAYVAKIFPEVATLTEEIICGGKDDWLPGIFRIASETLIKIFREHELATPPELKIFTWAEYLGEDVKSAQAVGTLERLFKFSRR